MKIVREHIYEKFSEKGDPIKDMNIGIDNYTFKVRAIIIWYTTLKGKRENKKWLEEKQIIEFLENHKNNIFNFGKSGNPIIINDIHFVGKYKNKDVGYLSVKEMINDNIHFIKYKNKYYKIK